MSALPLIPVFVQTLTKAEPGRLQATMPFGLPNLRKHFRLPSKTVVDSNNHTTINYNVSAHGSAVVNFGKRHKETSSQTSSAKQILTDNIASPETRTSSAEPTETEEVRIFIELLSYVLTVIFVCQETSHYFDAGKDLSPQEGLDIPEIIEMQSPRRTRSGGALYRCLQVKKPYL